MAGCLPSTVHMRRFGLLLAIVGWSFTLANAQGVQGSQGGQGAQGAQDNDAPEGALIQSTELSGLTSGRLSPGLRQEIDALVGKGLNRERVDGLAVRIETELPDRIVAVRAVEQSDGTVRVIFLVARISDDRDLASNINARYTVDRVEISGIADSKVSQDLRDALQDLVGRVWILMKPNGFTIGSTPSFRLHRDRAESLAVAGRKGCG